MRSAVITSGVIAIAALGVFELRDTGSLRAIYRDLNQEMLDWKQSRALVPVDCPDKAFVILALGQSNAANHLGSREVSRDGAPTFVSFRGRCAPLNDPVPGATGSLGSLWPTLASKVSRQSGLPVVVIARAVGGSSTRDWSEDVRRIRSRALRSVEAAIAVKLSPDAIIWIQGESDALATSAETYEEQLRQVVASVDAAIGAAQARTGQGPKMPKWIISLTSRCRELNPLGSEAIREAQRRVATTMANAQVGPDTDALGDEFRRDGCHFNDAGRAVLTDQLAAILARKIASVN